MAQFRSQRSRRSSEISRSNSNAVLPAVTLSESGGVRYLHLGSPWVQGAMRIGAPLDIELEYVQRMMAWMLFRPQEQVNKGHAVQLGLGAAAVTKFCRKRLRMRTTAVELNPGVIAACHGWFALPPDDDKLSVIEADAAAFAADRAHAGSVHALCVDLYDHEAASPVLDDQDFYRDCHRLLADGIGGHMGGVMSVNLFGRDASFADSMAAIADAFGEDQVWSLSPTREGNTIVIGLKGLERPDRELLARRAENIETRFKLPARKWLRLLRPALR